jgi:hypothetical protein
MGAYEGAGSGEGSLLNEAYVATTGNDTNSGTAGSPFATINCGVSQVSATGIVRVAAGRYVESVALGLDKPAVTVRGGYQPGTWSWNPPDQVTVIDGNGVFSPVVLVAGANTNTISYLTLKRGTGQDDRGEWYSGVRFLASYVSVAVEGCTVVSNSFGVYAERFMTESALTLRNTLIARNTYDGIYYYQPGGGPTYLYNCTVADNGRHGFYSDANADWPGTFVVTRNSLFTGNNGYGIYKDGTAINGSFAFCLFHNNASGPTNGINPGWSQLWKDNWRPLADLGDNTTNNPLYYDKYGISSYRLWQTSPAHNTGTNLLAQGVTMDIEGIARPDGAAFDRGAYERTISPFPGSVFTVR